MTELIPVSHIPGVVTILLVRSIVALLAENFLTLLIVVMVHRMMDWSLIAAHLLLILLIIMVHWHDLRGVAANRLVLFALPELILILHRAFGRLATTRSAAVGFSALANPFAACRRIDLLEVHWVRLALHTDASFLSHVLAIVWMSLISLILTSHAFEIAYGSPFLASHALYRHIGLLEIFACAGIHFGRHAFHKLCW